MLFLHVTSYSVWLGASLTFMLWGPASRRASLEVWAHSWMVLSTIQRVVVAPACLVATVTGVYLTMALVQSHFDMGSAVWLMVMQSFGLLAALLTLAIATPLVNRMGLLAARSLEKGVREPSAEAVRRRLALVGSIAGALIVVSIYFGEAKTVVSG
jgi:hypothetical protein